MVFLQHLQANPTGIAKCGGGSFWEVCVESFMVSLFSYYSGEVCEFWGGFGTRGRERESGVRD